jgi:hypothetical protein
VLFASRYALELSFGDFPVIDTLLENNFEDCYDCSSGYQKAKAFAMIKDVSGLYFVFSDNETAGKKVDFPSRSLVMQLDEVTTVNLWSESVDLFGCPCL